jgi:5'-3' exonuclease
MGIERFFSTLGKTFDIMIILDDKILEYEYIYIDFNSIIHNISSNVITNLNIVKKFEIKFDEINDIILQEIDIFLQMFLKKINLNNLKLLNIVVDGLPTFSKMLEQKKRRYIADYIDNLLEKYPIKINWSKNNISCGTFFMEKVILFLSNLSSNEFYKNINIQISDMSEKGEGEMKILDFINKLSENKNIIFFSPDSDVILLSMISNKSDNISVIKYDNDRKNFISIDIKKVKKGILEYSKNKVINDKINNNIINDIVFIFTIFGNDFLPKCESIQTNLDLLFLIDIYLICLIDKGYIIENDNLVDANLYYFFDLLKHHEVRLLQRNALENIFVNYNYANQKNFLLDLYKLKEIKKTNLLGKKFGDPFFNFYNNILTYIDPVKLKLNDKKYGFLSFYLINKYKLYDLLLVELNKKNISINNLLNIKINKNNNNYEKLKKREYKSTTQKHNNNMRDLSNKDKELYLINNKLDKYYNIFNPINDFYYRTIKIGYIDFNYYYNKNFNNNNQNKIVNDYLLGLRWLFQYYFTRKNINELWYYSYNNVPLFETIIKYYRSDLLTQIFEEKILDITLIEQFIYITPIRLSKINNLKLLLSENIIDKIKIFINKYPHFFYNLDKIYKNKNYNLFNCSHSLFINKCHYEILNNIIDINNFVEIFRSIKN